MQRFRMATVNLLNRPPYPARYRTAARLLQEQGVEAAVFQEVVDPELLEDCCKSAGLSSVVFATTPTRGSESQLTAVASRHPLQPLFGGNGAFMAVTTAVEGLPLLLHCGHFPWGGDREEARLLEAARLELLSCEWEREHPEGLVLLGGDLNCTPQSRTLRYLTGLDLGPGDAGGAYWVDAAESCGQGERPTNDPKRNKHAHATALGLGITRPELVPARRIDYLMVRGWRHGRVGRPLRYGFLGEDYSPFSDHLAPWADFLLSE